MLLIALFLLLYSLPSIILALLQCTHIKKALTKEAILLDSKDYLKAGYYALANLRLGIIEKIIDAVVFCAWISFGLGALWAYLSAFGLNFYLQGVIFLLLLFLISALIKLPLSLYQTFGIDKKYGFCKQSVGLFFVDLLKSSVLGILIGGAIFYGLLWVIGNFEYWWIAGFCLVFAIVIVANAIYPTLIAPLFNKFAPLEDIELKNRIESLLSQVGFKSSGVFVMDASKRDGRLNAYFGGIGRTKRVVLFDTLLDKISKDGLLAILGHELGHFKHKDILKNIFIAGSFLFVLFFIASHFPTIFYTQSALPQNSAGTLSLLLLLEPVLSFWFLPIMGYFSRKAEYGADAFGASLSSKNHLANALVRLVNENKEFPSSHPLYIFFYYSHPPLLERLKALDYEVSANYENMKA